MTKITTLIFLTITLLLYTSCDKETPEIPNEEEVITTLRYNLTPESGGDPVILSFQDLDGDGGNAPEISGGTLASNTTYTGTLELLNEQKSPAENITTEIKAEAEDHQFFFQASVEGLSISYDDMDADGNPLGLSTKLATTITGNGNLIIILRHEPNKAASGVVNGDISSAGGETDIEITFPLDVQ